VVRFLPALVVTDQQIDQAVTLFTDAVMEVDRELPHAA
jgi:acetylornithine/succinyldiaminopimelate/putrescine aminotransferase